MIRAPHGNRFDLLGAPAKTVTGATGKLAPVANQARGDPHPAAYWMT